MSNGYRNKCHSHKPRKGKGSYDRKHIEWPDLTFPPVNLNVLQSAYNFYEKKSYNNVDEDNSEGEE